MVKSVGLQLEKVSKSFGKVVALEQSTLTVEPGALYALLGPSGCGKTTTLRIIAGFEQPDTGEVIIDGRDVGVLPPNKRKLGMVFQNYSLFPHMTVGQNVAFGLRISRTSAGETKRRVGEMLELVQLSGFEDRFPSQLSGGQQQRVALARSLVTNPSALLLDEPLGALDKKLREIMQFELRRIQKTLGITTILVTHDQEEALTLSDKIAVMNQGRILQVGSPYEIYEFPKSRFVAEFLGTSNLFTGKVKRIKGELAEFTKSADGNEEMIKVHLQEDSAKEGEVAKVAVRPEKLKLCAADLANGSEHMPEGFSGSVIGHVFRGSYHAYEVKLPGQEDPIFVYALADSRSEERVFEIGQKVRVQWKPGDAIILTAD